MPSLMSSNQIKHRMQPYKSEKSKPTLCSFTLISMRMSDKMIFLSCIINYSFGYLTQLIDHFRVDHHFGRLHLFPSIIMKHEMYTCIKKIKPSQVIPSKWYSSKSLTLSQTANCLVYRNNYRPSYWLVQEHTEFILWVAPFTAMVMAWEACSW